MIIATGLTKVYGKKQSAFTALDDVSLQIPSGTTMAIVGKSGSGKSTLMHIMSGLDHPTSGTVTIDGQNIHRLKKKALDNFRATQMSFIFQSFFVEANQNCYQNVALPLEIAGVSVRQRKQRAKEALAQVELSEKIHEKARNLSGGQKQRLAIARAIVNEPKLIFADEPTGNLDSKTGEKIIDMLFELNKRLGATLVMVTHDSDLAARCHMEVNIKDGHVTSVVDHDSTRKKSSASSKRRTA